MRDELGEFEYTDDQRRRLLEKAKKLSPESIEKLGILECLASFEGGTAKLHDLKVKMKYIKIALIAIFFSVSGCKELVSKIPKATKVEDVQEVPDLLSIEKLREIIQGSHSDTLDVEALKIFPKARKYEVKMISTSPDGQKETIEMAPTEKWVDGQYVVSEIEIQEGAGKMEMVVEFHEGSQTYRKYIVIEDKLATLLIGIQVGDTRSITWIDLEGDKYSQKRDNLSYETHMDDKTVWTSIYLKGTALQWTEGGEAKVIE